MSKDAEQAPKRYTPQEWRRVGIAEQGKKFQLVALVSRIPISESDLKWYGLDVKTKCEGLTIAQALKTGAVIDAAAVAFHSPKSKK